MPGFLSDALRGVSITSLILLANPLQSSRSTFSWESFPSFFAFKEGMWDTQIAALLSSPTVSVRFSRQIRPCLATCQLSGVCIACGPIEGLAGTPGRSASLLVSRPLGALYSRPRSRAYVPGHPRMMTSACMPLTLVIRIALRALRRNTLRSVLSMLGISIGVGAFICSVAVGQGASQQIEEQIRSLGENFIWIEAGNRNVKGVRTGTHGTQSLTLWDMAAIQHQIPLLAQLSPNVDLRVQVIFRDQNW